MLDAGSGSGHGSGQRGYRDTNSRDNRDCICRNRNRDRFASGRVGRCALVAAAWGVSPSRLLWAAFAVDPCIPAVVRDIPVVVDIPAVVDILAVERDSHSVPAA